MDIVFSGFLLIAAIVIPDAATDVERTAAKELRNATQRMTGRVEPVVFERDAKGDAHFFVGATRVSEKLTPDKWRPDEILVAPYKKGVVLSGHPTRGPIYAVDVYLEEVCGVRWWTSTESHYPKFGKLPIPARTMCHAPVFRYRETYYRDGFNADFKVRSKGNFSSRTRYMFSPMEFIPKEKGGDHRLYFYSGRSSAYHSFFEVLPPSVYFASHPEWYSEIDGKREARQLCLTNEEMADYYIAETMRRLREDSAVDCISVSQNDWDSSCRCAKCMSAIGEEGAESGLYLRFVNKVAEAVEREFPHVMIDTFAYQFTRKPPKLARPRRNVIVRLCDIECAFNAPLVSSGMDDDFLDDLRVWGKIAPGSLYVWDYTTDFHSYMMPHPNMNSLGANIRLFADNGVVGVFEQGDALCSAGSFAALSHWVVSHLLWNPYRDAKELRDEFIRGYYGASAAPHVMRCRDIVDGAGETAAKRGVKVGCYHLSVTNFMDKATALAAADSLDEAISVARKDGEEYVRRLLRERLSFDHMKIVSWDVWKLPGSRREAVLRWIDDCRSFGVEAWRETTDKDDFVKYCNNLLTSCTD